MSDLGRSMKRMASVAMIAALFFAPGAALAQQAGTDPGAVRISLEEAVARALRSSREVRAARAQVELADAQVTAARAQALPQVDLNLGYTRTIESAFDMSGGFELPDSLRFAPDPSLPIEDRVAYLENRVPLAGLAAMGSLFSNMPFGQKNTYMAAISGSQILYSGGRVGAALDIADKFEESARLNLREAESEVELQVRTAYYQALLAKEMEAIASEALAQAERFLEEERLRHQAGRASELDLMRAEVSRDNLHPQLVQARNAAELAMLNLKRLLDLPLDTELELTTELVPPSEAELAAAIAAKHPDLKRRPAVEAAERQVAIAERQVDIAKGAFLPSVALTTSYGRQLFPSTAFEFDGQWRTDWTVSVGVSIPVFKGFQRTAELARARAQLESAKIQAAQLEAAVHLQYEQALGERERAGSAIAAREQTARIAQRVYDLTVLRYEQGVATQLEVSEARLAALQARTNLAQAVADFYIADAAVRRALGATSAAVTPGTGKER